MEDIEGINTSEYVIRKPMYWPVFLLVMFLISLSLCLWTVFGDVPPSPGSSLEAMIFYFIESVFYSIFGFSIWILLTIIVFVLLVINCYIYFRFKLVIHEQSFSVTPLFDATHDVAFSSVETVTNSKRFSRKGFYIEIKYDNKEIRIPYTISKDGTFRQTSIGVLLNKLENHTTIITTKGLDYPFK